MRITLVLLALLAAGCEPSAGAFEEVSGDGAPAACNELRAAFCGKAEECVDAFDEDACNADLQLDEVDCEDAESVRADIDGCVSALADASCDEAVEGTVVLFLPPCDEITVE
jgi:hypothetical protein